MATTYRIRFNNVEEQAVECTLTDETGDLDIIDIEGAEDAIHIVSQDNDENKFSPIKAKKCVIKFLNSQSVNFRTFATGEDNKWLVTVKINSLTVFIGHLEQGDIEEPFQYQENQIVILTATDGLGALKKKRLEDIYNVWTATGCGLNENRIIDYIAACLGSTGLELTINVINNLREIDNPQTDTSTFGNIYAALYLSLKTFEDQQVGQYKTCYDVLEMILGHDCFLTQAKGQWWIIRVTELRQDFNMSKTIFDFDGTVLDFETLNYEKGIGLKDIDGTPFPTPDATAYFSQDKTTLSLDRPVKSVTLKHNWENPFEILANQTLLRGDFIADLPDEVDEDGNTLTVKSFETECWEYDKDVPAGTNDSTEYTKVRYKSGAEVDRFVHMEATASNAFYYLRSLQAIPVSLNDRISLNLTVRYGDDVAGTGLFLKTQAQLRLTADDGTFWTCHVSVPGTLAPEPGKFWVQAPDGSWSTPVQKFLIWEDDADTVDFSGWNTLNFDCPPFPRSGTLEVILTNSNDPDQRTKDFASIELLYTPYIGGYNVFSSQSDKSTRDGNYFTEIDDEVFIGNLPRRILKGALLKLGGSDLVLVDQFYEGQQYDETTGPDHLATYGELRVRAYHNQFRNGDDIYKATCQGLGEGATLDSQDDHPDIIHRYFNKDLEPGTLVNAFQLVSQDVDLRNCEWTGTLIRTFNTDIGFVDDTYEFTYNSSASTLGGGGGGSGGGGLIPPGPMVNDRFGKSGEDDTATENRVFNVGTNLYSVEIDGENDTDPIFQAVNAGFGIGVSGASGNGTGVQGSGATGVVGISSTGNGVYGVTQGIVPAVKGFNNSSDGGVGGEFVNQPSSTNVVVPTLNVIRQTSGTADDGIGLSIDLYNALTSGFDISNQIISKWIDATTGSRTSQMIFSGVDNTTMQDLVTLNGDGSIQLNQYGAGTLTTDGSGNVTATSDERLKKIIDFFTGGDVSKINPIIYKWNEQSGNETEETYIGFSAQNIQEALGNNAVGINPNGYLNIQDRAIIAALVNSVKQLQDEVKDLKSKLNATD